MIISISHEQFWTEDGPIEHNIRPYFLLEDDDRPIPKLENVTEISESYLMDSWVNWNKRVKVRKVYLTHPSVTPKVSTEYYRLGFATFEQSVPFKIRVSADAEASGNWPLDTKGEWIKLKCLIYDIEELIDNDLLPCLGLGEFTVSIKSSVDLEKEDFHFDFKFNDDLKVSQLLADDRSEQLPNIYRPFVEKLKENSMTIGHNIVEWDNAHVYDRIKEFGEFKQFLAERTYEHQGFQRGRTAKRMLEIYPVSFDTLHAARFIWKSESDEGFGLKQLAQKFKIKVYELDNEGHPLLDKPTKRVYERDFGGFGRWDNHNDLCLKYNNHDIQETYGLFKLLAQPILINMFISGLSFEDAVSGSNGRMADQMCLIRGHDKIINPPMQHPAKIAKALQGHFNGELKTRKEIFEYFQHHQCNWDCVARFNMENEKIIETDEDEETEEPEFGGDTPGRLQEKLIRVTKYGEEMPEYVTYYPMLYSPYSRKEQQKDRNKVCYIAVGGKTTDPSEPLVPAHDVWKGDTAAQYPSIVKAKHITSDVVRLAKKGEHVDGWCWFRVIYNKNILNLFEWKPASEFEYSDGEGYFIGYVHRGREGLLGHALTGIIKAVGVYKKKPGWDEAYQKTLKPMRNALTHGVMLALDATCQQYNIAGCAIPTYGQEITTYMNKHLQENGWKILETDTDGTEFRKTSSDAINFINLVEDVEKYWTEQYNYPFLFDKDHSKHKLFIATKNYITIKDSDEVKLTGNTLHAADKPKIAEKCMKALALEVLSQTNTRQQLIGMVHERAVPIVNEQFKNITEEEMILTQFVKPPKYYDDSEYRARAEAIQVLTHKDILDPGTKMEFIVCENRLPGTHGEKTLAHPTSFMWPRQVIEEYRQIKDINWLKDMTFAYIDTVFELIKVSSKLQIKPLFGFEESEKDSKIDTVKNVQSSLTRFQNDGKDDTIVDTRKQRKLF